MDEAVFTEKASELSKYNNEDDLDEAKKALLAEYLEDKKDEKVVNLLGLRYLKRGLKKKRTRTVLVLTEKNLYQEGILLERIHGTLPRVKNKRNVIPIENITSTTYGTRYPLKYLVIALLLAVASFVVYRFRPDLLPLSILVTLIAALGYTFSKRPLLVIEHKEGNICLDAKWYKKKELFNFRESLYLIREDIYKESSKDPEFIKI